MIIIIKLNLVYTYAYDNIRYVLVCNSYLSIVYKKYMINSTT